MLDWNSELGVCPCWEKVGGRIPKGAFASKAPAFPSAVQARAFSGFWHHTISISCCIQARIFLLITFQWAVSLALVLKAFETAKKRRQVGQYGRHYERAASLKYFCLKSTCFKEEIRPDDWPKFSVILWIVFSNQILSSLLSTIEVCWSKKEGNGIKQQSDPIYMFALVSS